MMTSQTFARVVDHPGKQIDPRELVAHHLLVVGQTGSGKTTSTLALLSQLQQTDYTTIILDPTGEYAKLPNAVTYQLGQNAYLEAGNFSVDQLIAALELQCDEFFRARLGTAITSLRIQENLVGQNHPYVKIGRPISDYQAQVAQLGSWADSYQPQLLADQVIEEMVVPKDDKQANYQLLGQRYDRQMIKREWYTIATLRQRLASRQFRLLFDPDRQGATTKAELNFVVKMFLARQTSHRTLVIDLSALKQFGPTQQVVISLLLRNLLAARINSSYRFPVNIVIDEAHRYLPNDQSQLASNGIFQVLREGRKVGLSMTLTTQSPLDLPARLRSQFATVLLHHLTSPEELTSLALADRVSLAEAAQLRVGEAYLVNQTDTKVKLRVNLPQWWQG